MTQRDDSESRNNARAASILGQIRQEEPRAYAELDRQSDGQLMEAAQQAARMESPTDPDLPDVQMRINNLKVAISSLRRNGAGQ